MFSPNLLTKRQQRAVFVLILIIISLQFVGMFWPKIRTKSATNKWSDNSIFKEEYEALKQQSSALSGSKIFPFNPNFLTPYKAYELGLSNLEFQRLTNFRSKNLWINSVQDFKRVTKVSDSLLQAIEPYFRFPQWVINSQQSRIRTSKPKSKLDLNTATPEQLERIRGIGPVLSRRIIRFRNTFQGGFANMIELTAVYGLPEEVYTKLTQEFEIKNPRLIQKKNINTVAQEELVQIPYIDYELADQIIEQRLLKEHYKSLDELTKLKDFPIKYFDIIKLYLYINHFK